MADFNPDKYLATGEPQQTPLIDIDAYLDGGFESEGQRQQYVKNLPELTGVLDDVDESEIVKIIPALLSATDPKEFAQIITSNFPHISTQYPEPNSDPLLVNTNTNKTVQINKEGISPTDLLQLSAMMVAYSPAGRLTGVTAKQLGKLALGEAGTEAAIQGVQAASGGEFDVEDVALSGVTAPVAQLGADKLIKPVIKKGQQYVKDRMSPVADEIVEAGESFNVPVTTTDVMPPRGRAGSTVRQMAESVPVIGTSGVRADQRVGREQVTREFGETLPNYSELEIIEDLAANKDKLKSAAGKRIRDTIDNLTEAGYVDVSATLQKIDDALDQQTRGGKIPDEALINKLNTIRESLIDGAQDIELARENRTTIRGMKDSVDPNSKTQTMTHSRSVLEDIYSQLTKDIDGFVLNNTDDKYLKRYKDADRIYGEESRKIQNTRIKKILDDGDVKPEGVMRLLTSKSPSEVKLLYKSLSPKGRDNARAALLHKAWEGVEDEAGNVSPKKLVSNLRKLESQYGSFFKGADKTKIEGLRRLLQATTRADDAKVVTPSGMVNYVLVVLGGAGQAVTGSPAGAAAVTMGSGLSSFSSAYESAKVRDFLIKLGKAKKGSKEEQDLVDMFTKAVVPAVEVGKEAVKPKEDDARLIELKKRFGFE